jgi:hypothetical protein
VVTGLNMFFRSGGSAVGIAVFGALVNASLGRSGVQTDSVPPGPLTVAVHSVFLGTTVLAVVMLAAVLLMPRDAGRVRPTAPESVEAGAG